MSDLLFERGNGNGFLPQLDIISNCADFVR